MNNQYKYCGVTVTCLCFNSINRNVQYLILVLFLLPVQITAQYHIKGVIKDKLDNSPVPYASVYVDGTSNGTITDIYGSFLLNDLIPPCEIVISHISYETKVIEFEKNRDTIYHITLNPRDVAIEEIEVINSNRREENLNHFKDRFIGTDYWGRNAHILNDSVLVFKIELNNDFNESTGKLTADSCSVWFIVNAKGPILVDLPLLGFKLHIDLVKFIELQSTVKSMYEYHALGYFYFQPITEESMRKTNRFKKKRLQAYYYSDRHFCRSLFQNELKENGYYVVYDDLNAQTGRPAKKEFKFDTHIIQSGATVKVIGLKNRFFYIGYYELHNKPVNLKNGRDGRPTSISVVHFLKDTCVIRQDGTRPDNSIMFGPEIGNKRVGAMLPNEFVPNTDK